MSFRFSRLTLALPVLAAVVGAACSDSNDSNPKPAANVAMVSGAATKTTDAYSPGTYVVSLAAGGKVTWRNDDNTTHTATADVPADSTAGFYSGNLAPGDTVTVDFSGFAANDTLSYHCTIHNGMVGVVIVNP
jgi:plastocyanin